MNYPPEITGMRIIWSSSETTVVGDPGLLLIMMMMFSFPYKEKERIFFSWSGFLRVTCISRLPASEEIHPINFIYIDELTVYGYMARATSVSPSLLSVSTVGIPLASQPRIS